MADVVSNVRFFATDNLKGNTVALGSFELGGKVRINCAIKKRKDGKMFVALPQHPGKSKDGDQVKYFDDIFIIDDEWRHAVQKVVIDEFKSKHGSDQSDGAPW